MEIRTLSRLLLTAFAGLAIEAHAGGFLSKACDLFLGSRHPSVQAEDSQARAVIGDLNAFWRNIFASRGWPLRELIYREFQGSIVTGCGPIVTAQGPIYCQVDQTLYVDRAWFHQYRHAVITGTMAFLKYVLAHEMAHHLQNHKPRLVIGQALAAMGGAEIRNQYLKNMELQADCLAGLYLDRAGLMHTPEQIMEFLLGVGLVGDDFVEPTGGYPHGTAVERLTWFDKGMHANGDIGVCEPFTFPIFLSTAMDQAI